MYYKMARTILCMIKTESLKMLKKTTLNSTIEIYRCIEQINSYIRMLTEILNDIAPDTNQCSTNKIVGQTDIRSHMIC